MEKYDTSSRVEDLYADKIISESLYYALKNINVSYVSEIDCNKDNIHPSLLRDEAICVYNRIAALPSINPKVLQGLDNEFYSRIHKLGIRSREVLKYNKIHSSVDFLPWIKGEMQACDLKYSTPKSIAELGVLINALRKIFIGNAPRTNEENVEDHVANNYESRIDAFAKTICKREVYDKIICIYGNVKVLFEALLNNPASIYQTIWEKDKRNAYDCIDTILNGIDTIVSVENKDLAYKMKLHLNGTVLENIFLENREILVCEKYITEDKEVLLNFEFEKLSKKCSVRCKNAMSINGINNFKDFLKYHNNVRDFRLLKNAGAKCCLELEQFMEKFYPVYTDILYSNDDLEGCNLKHEFPFLTDSDIDYISQFNDYVGHLPMLLIICKYFESVDNKTARIYSDYYGLSGQIPMTLDEIAEKYTMTRERIRQILVAKEFVEETAFDGFRYRKNWEGYAFWSLRKIDEDNSGFKSLSAVEHLNISFYAFCGICRALDNYSIYTFSDEGKRLANGAIKSSYLKNQDFHCFAYKGNVDGLMIYSIVADIRRTILLQRITNQTLSLYNTYIENDEYWSKKYCVPDKNMLSDAYGLLLVVMGCLWPNIRFKGTNVILEANKINYGEEAYLILKKHGIAMYANNILKEIVEKYPNDSHNSLASLKRYMSLDGRIVPIGKTSKYKLLEWKGSNDCISEIIVDLVRNSEVPIKKHEIVDAVLKERPDTTERSVNSLISQKMSDNTLRLFYGDYVGMNGYDYDDSYKIFPRNFPEWLESFVNFVVENKRYPMGKTVGYESSLYRWYAKAKELVALSEEEIIMFSNTMNDLERYHYPHGDIEMRFLQCCKQYKDFVIETGRLVQSDDELPLYKWFDSAKRQYLVWTDNRKYYFMKLLDYLSDIIKE